MRRVYRVLAAFSPPRDRGVLRSLVRSANRAGALPADLSSLLESALELPDLHVRDAMVARVDVVAVPDTCGMADAGRHMAKHGHKRLPVFHGANRFASAPSPSRPRIRETKRRRSSHALLALIRSQPAFAPDQRGR